ncbi:MULTISPECIES: hypothetical protein [Klebsiella]|uniref:hypothetical protein n=1 Tax=Klebsiella TaxID=570 RepID=UPI0012B86766|nr:MULTISPECIES: hypothetical protein [Klebsiella]HCQ7474026.1 hypothetical protein [Klebsiella michiganensis]HDH1795542.1 hypothetical protein [Klebsiella quasipneumoniae subsp. similipneumoniae]MED6015712.1 hypothetical protein [Klebsiella pneumoniae]HBS6541888.1 hypothetical protein [Klebsiella pneumoniae]HBV4450222.1 hypothetical protein [Klebsiella pneumoniae]
MMNSDLTITRKRLEAIAYGSVRQSQEEGIELARLALKGIDQQPVAWVLRPNVVTMAKSVAEEHGGEPLYTYQPPSSDLALEQNFRDAMEGIEHIRRALEETFGGLHGTHCEPDILMDCKKIVDAIYAAYRRVGKTDSDGITYRVVSIKHKKTGIPDDFSDSDHNWLEATLLPIAPYQRDLVMWIKRLSLALRSASPDNKLPKAAMSYLQNNDLINIADCLRGNNEEPPA